MRDYAFRLLKLLGWSAYFALVFWLVRAVARRIIFRSSERKVLLFAAAFGGVMLTLAASRLIAGLVSEPFDLAVIAAIGLAAIAAFFAILTA
jgi:uncharacterized membrane protein YkvI